MKDFKAAFEAGQLAYEKSEVAKREIADVITDFAAQVKEVSDGKIIVERRLRQAVDCLEASSSAKRAERYELCSLRGARSGYPIVITLNGNDTNCYDRSILESALEDVLRDPSNAGMLRTLMTDI